jgi:hypothetical protein
MMPKTDFKRTLKHLYGPPSEFTIVDVPEMQFLMIDGHGDPNTAQEYKDAVEALYAVAYKVKFASKRELDQDYVVPPLEGLWWAEDMGSFVERAKSEWDWTMMIMQPDWITLQMVEMARQQAPRSKDLPALPKLRLESYGEGLAVQILHLGSYDDETPTIAQLHGEFLPANGLVEAGKHHEIYLSDPRRTAPEKLRTVIRQPVRRI